MKQYLLVSFLVVAVISDVLAQDRIITQNNDTIDCRIIKVSEKEIKFDIKTGGISATGRIPRKDVRLYTISENIFTENNTSAEIPFSGMEISLNGGPGYLVASSSDAESEMVSQGISPEAAKDYFNDLRLGIYTLADAIYRYNQESGLGIRYKFFATSAKTEGFIDPQDGVNLIYGTYKEQIYVNFLAATFLRQKNLNPGNSLRLSSSFSAGVSLYRNEAEYFNSFYLIKGKSFGVDAGIGLEYLITNCLSVSSELSVFYSSIRRMEISDGSYTTTIKLPKDKTENLSRIDFSVGLRIYLWDK